MWCNPDCLCGIKYLYAFVFLCGVVMFLCFGVFWIVVILYVNLVHAMIDGAGGKGTWGKLLDTGGESFLDRNDPNYDSGEVSYN